MEMLIVQALQQGGPWVLLIVLLPILVLIVGVLAVAFFALNKARQEDVPTMFKDFIDGVGRWPNPLGGFGGAAHADTPSEPDTEPQPDDGEQSTETDGEGSDESAAA